VPGEKDPLCTQAFDNRETYLLDGTGYFGQLTAHVGGNMFGKASRIAVAAIIAAALCASSAFAQNAPTKNKLRGGDDGGGGPHGECRPSGWAVCVSDNSQLTGCVQSRSIGYVNGQCTDIDRACTGCSHPCAGGVFCGKICVDLTSNQQNCGTCGHACPDLAVPINTRPLVSPSVRREYLLFES
jgi:hypothetical protein